MVQIFYYSGNIACDIAGLTTKAPCEAALMGERHVRIEISDFVMRTFVPTGTTVLQGGIKNACNVLTCMDTAGAYFAAVKCKKPEQNRNIGRFSADATAG